MSIDEKDHPRFYESELRKKVEESSIEEIENSMRHQYQEMLKVTSLRVGNSAGVHPSHLIKYLITAAKESSSSTDATLQFFKVVEIDFKILEDVLKTKVRYAMHLGHTLKINPD